MIIQQAYEKVRDPIKRAREDILVFNHIKGRFLFTAEEQTKESDAALGQRIQELEQQLHLDSKSQEALFAHAKALMMRSFKKVQKRLWAEAIEDWQKILAIDPAHQRAKNNILFSYITLGYSYAEHNLYDEAIELWEKAALMNPDDEQLIHNLAIANELGGHLDKAKRYWAETLKRWQARLDANSSDLYLKNSIIELHRHHGGQTVEQGGSSVTSIDQYKEILKINPNDFEAQFKIATSLMENQSWGEAAAALANLHKQFPKNIEVLNLLGWAHLNAGHIEDSFQVWQRSLAMDPNNYSTRENILKARMQVGKAFRNKGMYTQSLVHFKALLRFAPKSAEVHMEIGQTYMLKGDKRSAAEAFKMVMQLDPKNAEARQNLSNMKLRT